MGGVPATPTFRRRSFSNAIHDGPPARVRIVAPTGAEDLTSGKWQALPVVGARYTLPELSTGG